MNLIAAEAAILMLNKLGYLWSERGWVLVDPVKVPGDIELDDLADDFHGYAGNYTRHGYPIPKFNHVGYARALLARYGQPTQPIVPLEKADPRYEEGSTDVFGHAQRQSYVDGWNSCRRAMLEAAPEVKG